MARKDEDLTPEERRTRETARRIVTGLGEEDLHALLSAMTTGRGLLDPEPPPRHEPLVLPDPPERPVLLRVRVDLDGARPAIWRRLEVRGDLTMARLHDVLQAAMGWTDSHLHRFWPGPSKQLWTGPFLGTDLDEDDGETEGMPHERDVLVGQLLRAPGDRAFYTYDFGDGWHHTLKVEAVGRLPEAAPPAVCTGGRHACPPEDVGGVHTYNDLVAAWLQAPDRSTMDEMYVDWLPSDWDPTDFSADEATRAIALVGLDVDQLLALLEAAPRLRPEVQAVLDRAPQGLSRDLGRVTTWLQHTDDDVADLDHGAMARAVRPWRVLLDLAGTEGLALTDAGFLRPAVVEQVFTELGMGEHWIGKGNREDLTPPVYALRRSAQRLGLLRRSKGRLLRTPAARRLTDDARLWRYLTHRALPTHDGVAQEATVLWLLAVAEDGDTGGTGRTEVWEQVADALRQLGWHPRHGGALTAEAAFDAARDARDLVQQVTGGTGRRATPDRQIARAFARRAVLRE